MFSVESMMPAVPPTSLYSMEKFTSDSYHLSDEESDADSICGTGDCDQWQEWAKKSQRQQRRGRGLFSSRNGKKKASRSSLLDDDVDASVEQFMQFASSASTTPSSRSNSSSSLRAKVKSFAS